MKGLLYKYETEGNNKKEEEKEKMLLKYVSLKKKSNMEIQKLNEKIQKLKVELIHSNELYEVWCF